MQTDDHHSGSLYELKNSLMYQKHLFDSSRKDGARFDELKRIHVRIKELERDIRVLKRHSANGFSNRSQG